MFTPFPLQALALRVLYSIFTQTGCFENFGFGLKYETMWFLLERDPV